MKIILAFSVCTCLCFASGYRIPEQSLNSVALSAYTATANGADASYYNPANMAWEGQDYNLEASFKYINLSSVNFENNSKILGTSNAKSKRENAFAPTLFLTTPKFYDNFVLGMAITAPAGLSKRWQNSYASASAQEFSLKIVEVNPSIAYMINDYMSMAFGLRAAYVLGKVNTDASMLGLKLSSSMTGNTFGYGYNLALSLKPMENFIIATTFKSKIAFNVKGDADHHINNMRYEGDVSLKIPLPAVFNIGAAYTLNKTTVELVFEREFWSSYKELDFEYTRKLPVFDSPVVKNWKDVNSYRIGITHQYNDKLKLMGGFTYDKNPVPNNTMGFELPDSDSFIYSGGFEYKINDNLSYGLGYLYCDKKKRTIDKLGDNPITTMQGKISSNAHILNASLKYRF